MTDRPRPTPAVHFTRVENLVGIVAGGLQSDAMVRASSQTVVEVGDPAIKERRRGQPVGCGAGGSVGDYVPMYFTPRTSMSFLLHKRGMCFERVVYLQTSVERVQALGLTWVVSNRNAAQALAEFTDDPTQLGTHVDWAIIRSSSWGRTDDDPDRPYRRQAELLVHRVLPWLDFERVVTKRAAVAAEARSILEAAGRSVAVDVIPGWYF
jgi:hypothetical protein